MNDQLVYSLQRLKTKLITNTDGTISGTFEEIYKHYNTVGNNWEISVNIAGYETLLFWYEKLDDDKIIIYYADTEVDLN